jgi:hypothetical protein
MGKKKNIPDYLKNSLQGTTVGGSLGVDDTEYVIVPKGTLNISKGKTTIEGGVAKPISKFDKENINSEISLGISREFDDESGGVSLTGTKSGKDKSATFVFSKKLSKGGESRGTGAAIRGKGFKGVF